MAITTSGRLKLTAEAYQVIQDGIEAGNIPAKIFEDLDLRNGTAEGKIDVAYPDLKETVAASGTTTYDLASFTKHSVIQGFTDVVAIIIRNKRTTALATLEVGPNATNGFGTGTIWKAQTDRTIIDPSGWMVWYSPAGVLCDPTHKSLDIDTSAVAGATNSWDLLVLGRSV